MRRATPANPLIRLFIRGFVSPGPRVLTTALAFAAASFAVHGAAVAAPAAVEEYVLDIPTADDEQHPQNDNADSAAVAASSPAPAPAAPAPSDAEPDSKRAAENAPAPDRTASLARPALSLAADSVAGNSPIAALTRALTSGSQSGTGPLLPIVLGLALAGVLATVIARRRGDEG